MGNQLDPKVPGRHRWIGLATFAITADDAAAWLMGAVTPAGSHNIVAYAVICADCCINYPDIGMCLVPPNPAYAEVTADA